MKKSLLKKKPSVHFISSFYFILFHKYCQADKPRGTLKKTAGRQGTVLCLLNLLFEKETENRPLSPENG